MGHLTAIRISTAITMLRQAIFTSARAASRWSCARATPIARQTVLRSSAFPSRQQLAFQGVRCYAASAGLSKDEVQGRILDLLKNFDKVTDASKVHGTWCTQSELLLTI